MSYDIWAVIDTGGEFPVEVADVGNHTSNCSPMWRLALRSVHPNSANFDLRDFLESMTCGEMAPIVLAACEHMRAPENAQEYERLAPENKWGSVESATRYLEKIHTVCAAHPKAKLRVSC